MSEMEIYDFLFSPPIIQFNRGKGSVTVDRTCITINLYPCQQQQKSMGFMGWCTRPVQSLHIHITPTRDGPPMRKIVINNTAIHTLTTLKFFGSSDGSSNTISWERFDDQEIHFKYLNTSDQHSIQLFYDNETHLGHTNITQVRNSDDKTTIPFPTPIPPLPPKDVQHTGNRLIIQTDPVSCVADLRNAHITITQRHGVRKTKDATRTYRLPVAGLNHLTPGMYGWVIPDSLQPGGTYTVSVALENILTCRLSPEHTITVKIPIPDTPPPTLLQWEEIVQRVPSEGRLVFWNDPSASVIVEDTTIMGFTRNTVVLSDSKFTASQVYFHNAQAPMLILTCTPSCSKLPVVYNPSRMVINGASSTTERIIEGIFVVECENNEEDNTKCCRIGLNLNDYLTNTWNHIEPTSCVGLLLQGSLQQAHWKHTPKNIAVLDMDATVMRVKKFTMYPTCLNVFDKPIIKDISVQLLPIRYSKNSLVFINGVPSLGLSQELHFTINLTVGNTGVWLCSTLGSITTNIPGQTRNSTLNTQQCWNGVTATSPESKTQPTISLRLDDFVFSIDGDTPSFEYLDLFLTITSPNNQQTQAQHRVPNVYYDASSDSAVGYQYQLDYSNVRRLKISMTRGNTKPNIIYEDYNDEQDISSSNDLMLYQGVYYGYFPGVCWARNFKSVCFAFHEDTITAPDYSQIPDVAMDVRWAAFTFSEHEGLINGLVVESDAWDTFIVYMDGHVQNVIEALNNTSKLIRMDGSYDGNSVVLIGIPFGSKFRMIGLSITS